MGWSASCINPFPAASLLLVAIDVSKHLKSPQLPLRLQQSLSLSRLLFGDLHQLYYSKSHSSFYDHLESEDMPTLVSALTLSTNSKLCVLGTQTHSHIVKLGFTNDTTQNNLINMYSQCGVLGDGLKMFDEMPQGNLVCWTLIISGAVQNGEYEMSVEIHRLIVQSETEASTSVTNAVMDMYFKNAEKGPAFKLFNAMQARNIVSWNTIFAGSSQDVDAIEVAILFKSFMFTSLKPNHLTFSILLRLGGDALELGLILFDSITSDYGMEPSPDNYGTFVDILSRNGFLQDAKHAVEAMPFKTWPEIWRSLLNGYRIPGDRELGELAAMKLFHLVPENDATYACCRMFIQKMVIGKTLQGEDENGGTKNLKKLRL
ncbi:mitochondrial RNAediting factor 1 [Actinidia rufa]|uniref:Mitochondrial RNAediting factor 1 n=1 Tax=Actinidia rufa TaxID=165716 RepID=A0A7J0DNS7_9ERIC|nr:mitochondrial RNAediting factor 1 [Actinidia rufa]